MCKYWDNLLKISKCVLCWSGAQQGRFNLLQRYGNEVYQKKKTGSLSCYHLISGLILSLVHGNRITLMFFKTQMSQIGKAI